MIQANIRLNYLVRYLGNYISEHYIVTCNVTCIMIKSFSDKETGKIYQRNYSKEIPEDIQRRAYRKLLQIDLMSELEELRSPPGNRLEKLKGDREGQHSIRVNQKWRICFEWKGGDAYDVEITDYH